MSDRPPDDSEHATGSAPADADAPNTSEEDPFLDEEQDPFTVDGSVESDEDFTDESDVPFALKDTGGGRGSGTDNKQRVIQSFDNLGATLAGKRLRTVITDVSETLLSLSEETNARIEKQESHRSLQDYVRRIKHVEFDYRWSKADERDLVQRLNDDPYYRYVKSLGLPAAAQNSQFVPMWKKICKVLQCAPTDIVGRKTCLVYGVKTVTIDGRERPNPNWHGRFCHRLLAVALGGPCGRDVDLLALFIRYAVACRLNDHGRFPFLGVRGDSNCAFLKMMAAGLEKRADFRLSVAQVHKKVRGRMRAKGFGIPWYSDVMRNLEKLAYRDSTPPSRTRGEPLEVYPVTTEDLHNLEKAFDGCELCGRPRFPRVEHTLALFSHKRTDFPEDSSDIRMLREALYLAEERTVEMRRRGLHEPAASQEDESDSPTTGQYDDDGGPDVVMADADILSPGSTAGDGINIPDALSCPLPAPEDLLKDDGPEAVPSVLEGEGLGAQFADRPYYTHSYRSRNLPHLPLTSALRRTLPFFGDRRLPAGAAGIMLGLRVNYSGRALDPLEDEVE
ncbi:hypothetical protein F5B20DRAFT_591447 [Whalleya microplaca]|nr:hypothetical protein F5B20DRAFT_591447 [Whalleya microplaca]